MNTAQKNITTARINGKETDMTTIDFTAIDEAATLDEALSLTGKINAHPGTVTKAHFTRLAYIKARRGHRAVGGFFNPTKANVTAKFIETWEAQREGRNGSHSA